MTRPFRFRAPPCDSWRWLIEPRCLLALALAALAAGSTLADEPVAARQQMVVAANPHATRAGIEILRAGGGAVDAAIAVQLVLSMVEPQSSGVGGGAFLLYYDAEAPSQTDTAVPDQTQVTVYSGRETAPAAADPEMFLTADGRPGEFFQVGFGGLPVGVPGVMRMLELAHREHGRLPWAELFEPAIELAEQGFEVSPRLYFLLDRARRVAQAPEFLQHYFDEHGEPYPVGHLLTNAEYAQTLRLLARAGADAMYSGELAERIVAAVNDNPISIGQMTLDDLAAYRPTKSPALCTGYRTYLVCGPRLPSSGGIAVQQILALVERFDLSVDAMDRTSFVHVAAEAGRLAFADRNYYLADPDFVDVPVGPLMSPAYLRSRSGLIDRDSVLPSVTHGTPAGATAYDFSPSRRSDLTSTSHFSIVDRFGGAVSMTSSVQGAFGSQLMVGGFLLNNQLTDFSMEPEIDGRPVANRAEGGKRPLSSMSPTIILDGRGRVHMLIGSPGGTRIINYVSQTILNVLDRGMNIQDAVGAPHFVSRGGPVELERDTDIESLIEPLTALGHNPRLAGLNSGLHGIVIDYDDDGGRRLLGGVDPRREGLALGD